MDENRVLIYYNKTKGDLKSQTKSFICHKDDEFVFNGLDGYHSENFSKIKAKDAKGVKIYKQLSIPEPSSFDNEFVKKGYAFLMPKSYSEDKGKFIKEVMHIREDLIRKELSGNICRCTGYTGIIKAVNEVMENRFKNNC